MEALRKYDAALRANGATGLYIFGSRARGTNRPDSDLDLFIDYDPDVRVPKLLRLMDRAGDFR
jgi:predicted nucleotidyltransferase